MKIVICPLTGIVGPHVLRNILIEVNKKKGKIGINLMIQMSPKSPGRKNKSRTKGS